MTKQHDATVKGVRDAWDFRLSQHDISVPETILSAVKEAFGGWLNRNSDELITAIAKEIVTSRGHLWAGIADAARRPAAKPVLPKWCGKCGLGLATIADTERPAAACNPRFRLINGEPCADCHPNAVKE